MAGKGINNLRLSEIVDGAIDNNEKWKAGFVLLGWPSELKKSRRYSQIIGIEHPGIITH